MQVPPRWNQFLRRQLMRNECREQDTSAGRRRGACRPDEPSSGLTWRPIFDHERAFTIGDVAVAVARSQPTTVCVGTGEAQPRFAAYAYPGAGVFKSVNGGESSLRIGLAETQHIAKVLIHPTNANVMFVAAMGHQWSANKERGVFRTVDGGAHWQHVLWAVSGETAPSL
jgi:hypothetical protein